MEEVLWQEFKKYSALLEEIFGEIIDDLISQIHDVKEDEIVIAGELTLATQGAVL